MARGSKAKYTNKQIREAGEIAERYKSRGMPEKRATAIAWATINKMYGGGKKSGSGRGKPINLAPARQGGRKGGAAAAARPAWQRSASARKAASTRARRGR